MADLQDLKANPNREANGTIIESKVDKGRGNVATVLVQTGTLKVGDIVTVGKTYGRVRASCHRGRTQRQDRRAGDRGRDPRPQGPARGGGPAARGGRREGRARRRRGGGAPCGRSRCGQPRGHQRPDPGSEVKELRVILKTDVGGSLGAIRHALDNLSTAETRINILSEGRRRHQRVGRSARGGLPGSGRRLASKLDPGAERAVEASGVDVRLYEVIYKLTDDIQLALQGLLTPR